MDSVFIECFSALKEPRVERTRKHIFIGCSRLEYLWCFFWSGGLEEIEDFGKEHENWFRQFLELPHGIPSHDTISRVFSALDPAGLQSCCINWLKRISQLIAEDIIAIDGKALRGSKRVNECKKALHIINACPVLIEFALGN